MTGPAEAGVGLRPIPELLTDARVDARQTSQIGRFRDGLEARRSLRLDTYAELHPWSVQDRAQDRLGPPPGTRSAR